VQHFCAKLDFPGTAAVRQPLAVKIVNFTGASKARQFFQRGFKNCFAACAIVRRTEGACHRMIDEGSTRRGDSAHDVVGSADHQCGDAAGFDHVSDETDGLVAEGSVGHKQREIYLGGQQLLSDRRRQFVFNSFVLAYAAHERIMSRCKTADDSPLN